ncbi:MAG TPA: hypothetical protein VF306_16930 [Pirellulales bacterium]
MSKGSTVTEVLHIDANGLPLRMVDATELSEKASALRHSKRRRR